MIERLFVYGSLAPGKANAHLLEGIPGQWMRGAVRGHLRDEGWGAVDGFPGLVLDSSGEQILGMVFASAHLSSSWDELDAFEGDDYRRVKSDVTLEDNERVSAYV